MVGSWAQFSSSWRSLTFGLSLSFQREGTKIISGFLILSEALYPSVTDRSQPAVKLERRKLLIFHKPFSEIEHLLQS